MYLEQLSKNRHAPTLEKNGHGSLSGLVSRLVRNPSGNSFRTPAMKSSTLCLNSFSWLSRCSFSRWFFSSISLILFCSRSHSSRIRNWKSNESLIIWFCRIILKTFTIIVNKIQLNVFQLSRISWYVKISNCILTFLQGIHWIMNPGEFVIKVYEATLQHLFQNLNVWGSPWQRLQSGSVY